MLFALSLPKQRLIFTYLTSVTLQQCDLRQISLTLPSLGCFKLDVNISNFSLLFCVNGHVAHYTVSRVE